jgi:hypothetical protein
MHGYSMRRTQLTVLCAVAALLGAGLSAPAARATRQVTTLPRIGGIYESLASAPGVLVASAADGIEVYSTGAAGWGEAGVPAALTVPAGVELSPQVSTDGQVVLAKTTTEVLYSDATTEYVYDEPSIGWSGTVAPSATLSTGTDAQIENAFVSGQTIAADANNGSIYVYQEPADGWTGTLTPVARLIDPAIDRGAGEGLSIQPDAIYAATDQVRRAIYDIFSEPAGGWTGTIAPSGSFSANSTRKLDVQSPSGFAAGAMTGFGPDKTVQILPIPSPGATKRPRPLADLEFPNANGTLAQTLLSPSFAVLRVVSEGDASSGDRSELFAISNPHGGWAGTVTTRRPIVRACDFSAVALQGRLLFVEDLQGPIRVLSLSRRLEPRTTNAGVQRAAARGRGCGNSNP